MMSLYSETFSAPYLETMKESSVWTRARPMVRLGST